jgi:hypothetical protein
MSGAPSRGTLIPVPPLKRGARGDLRGFQQQNQRCVYTVAYEEREKEVYFYWREEPDISKLMNGSLYMPYARSLTYNSRYERSRTI